MVITLIAKGRRSVAEPIKRKVVSFQLKEEEVDRFDQLETAGSARNKLYKRDALLRELVGLDDFDLVSEDEWLYFRGKLSGMPVTLKKVLDRASLSNEPNDKPGSNGHGTRTGKVNATTPRRRKGQGKRKTSGQ